MVLAVCFHALAWIPRNADCSTSGFDGVGDQCIRSQNLQWDMIILGAMIAVLVIVVDEIIRHRDIVYRRWQ